MSGAHKKEKQWTLAAEWTQPMYDHDLFVETLSIEVVLFVENFDQERMNAAQGDARARTWTARKQQQQQQQQHTVHQHIVQMMRLHKCERARDCARRMWLCMCVIYNTNTCTK